MISDDGRFDHLFQHRRPSAALRPVDQNEVYIFGLLVVGLAPDGRMVISLCDPVWTMGQQRRQLHQAYPTAT